MTVGFKGPMCLLFGLIYDFWIGKSLTYCPCIHKIVCLQYNKSHLFFLPLEPFSYLWESNRAMVLVSCHLAPRCFKEARLTVPKTRCQVGFLKYWASLENVRTGPLRCEEFFNLVIINLYFSERREGECKGRVCKWKRGGSKCVPGRPGESQQQQGESEQAVPVAHLPHPCQALLQVRMNVLAVLFLAVMSLQWTNTGLPASAWEKQKTNKQYNTNISRGQPRWNPQNLNLAFVTWVSGSKYSSEI